MLQPQGPSSGTERRRVVVTGTGAVTSLGAGAQTLTRRWVDGESGIEDGHSRCSDFDAVQTLGRKEARRTDRFTQLAIAAAEEALEEAGWQDETPYPAERVGCLIGTGVGGIATLEHQYENVARRGKDAISPMTVPMMMPNSAAGHLGMRHRWQGPSFAVGSACATGGHAIGLAVRILQSGEADAMVCGATDAGLTTLGIGSFRAMEAMSPTGTSRPFDARRDGFVMGEGAGALILETLEGATARGAEVLAEVRGYATTTDAYHITAPDPTARGATRAIEMALADGGVGVDEVDYVNAHGTATELNDRAETMAIKRAFGACSAQLPVSSLKSAIGHLMGAAGVVEVVATIHALRGHALPPTIGYDEPEDGMDLDYVPVSRPLDADGELVALSNAFGFGGHNVVVCLGLSQNGTRLL